MNRLRVKDLFNLETISVNNTIFDNLVDQQSFPLVKDFIYEDIIGYLDYDYLLGYSADKYLSPLAVKLYKQSENPDDVSDNIAPIIYTRFAEKWKKIYDALMTEYNPLENYSMEEIRTPDLAFDETENQKTGMNTKRETSASNSYKGFNANDPVLMNKTDGEENVDVTGAKLDNEVTKSTTHTGTETLTRSGNIGVTTSQQMLESEFKVRQYDFYKMIYNDIDSILCLSIY